MSSSIPGNYLQEFNSNPLCIDQTVLQLFQVVERLLEQISPGFLYYPSSMVFLNWRFIKCIGVKFHNSLYVTWLKPAMRYKSVILCIKVTSCYNNERVQELKFNKSKKVLFLERTFKYLYQRGGETHYMIVLLNDWFAIIPSKTLSIKDY